MLCFLVIIGTILGVYYGGVACPDFGSNCAPSPAPAPGPAPGPVPGPATPGPASTPGPTSPAGTPSPVATAPIPPPPPAVPNVVGMAYQFGSAGDSSGAPQLWFSSYGSVNTTVRVRGTSLTMPVNGGPYTNGDVFVKLGAPYTGTIILEKTDGTELARKTLNNETSTVFGGAAHN